VSKQEIIADPEKCRRCLICQLVCSATNEDCFSPSKARIKIGATTYENGKCRTEISFSDDCTGCGLCVVYCPYGALSASKARPILEFVRSKEA
jgi:Fe-S-cluster-containing hydrogenase component 2